MKLEWKEEAKLEFEQTIIHYYFEEPGLDLRFADAVDAAIEKVEKQPELRRLIDDNHYILRTAVFPYNIIYTIYKDTIWIEAVMHQSRQPDYWKGR